MNATFTPKQKYANATHQHTINSAPSSIMTKESNIPSPTQPPSYKSAAPLSTSDMESCSDTSSPTKSKQTNQGTALKSQKDVPNPLEEAPQTSIVVRHQNPSSSKRKPKGNTPNMASASTLQRQEPAASRTTLIRRVQAVVHVKREESDDDSVAEDDAFDDEEFVVANQRRLSRRIRKIVKDDEDIEQNYLASDGNPVCESRHLRHRSTVVNCQEDDNDEDEDELIMGAEV